MATIRLFAAAADALGTHQITTEVRTLGELKSFLNDNRGVTVENILAKCSYLVAGQRASDNNTPIADDAVVDVLPPFAGG